MSSFIPAGIWVARSGSDFVTASQTSIVLAFDCLMIPSPTASFPFHRAAVRSSSAPTVTSATSVRRTVSVPSCFTMMAPNSSAVASSPRVRTENSRSFPSTRPAGISAFSVRSARSTSCVVSPWEAIR